MLVCPDCNHILTEEAVPTDAPGGMIHIYRCTNCGGVWFNHFDINRFPTYHAIRLAGQMSREELTKTTGLNRCPHCNVPLKPLTAESLPDTAHVRTCPICRGHWVSKKDLVRIKKNQDELLIRAKLINIPLPTIYSVLIPLLILGLITAAVPFTVNRLKKSQESQIRARELIGTPIVIPIETGKTTRAIFMSFSTASPVTSMIELRSPQIAKPQILPISTTLKKLHTLKLTDLKAQSSYSYKIITVDANGVKTESAEYQFTTD